MATGTYERSQPESWFKELVTRIPTLICEIDVDGTTLFANDATFPATGYQTSQLEGRNWWDTLYPGELRRQVDDASLKSLGDAKAFEMTHISRDGSQRTMIWNSCRGREANGTLESVVLVGVDVTELRQHDREDVLNRVVQSVLSAILRVSLLDIPLEDQLDLILKAIVLIPWISLEAKGAVFLVDDDQDVLVMKAHYQLSKPLESLCQRVRFGHCLCGLAASSGEVQFASIVDARHVNRYDDMPHHGHYCVPIQFGGAVLGVLNLYLREAHQQNDSEVAFLRAVADVLASIVQRRRAEEALKRAHDGLEVSVRERTVELAAANKELRVEIAERKCAEEAAKRSLEKLELAFRGTIRAVARTVEIRDAYTAGHQRRVAQLAYLIAKEMNLSEEQAGVVQLAAEIHDIGKIGVPSEILSKPGKVSDPEFVLIRAHPQLGYDILKSVEFPWPIAEIILQHHERMDGSGYPSGLAGNDILLEARILAVADVVEAMVSHRPYRPALGIQAARSEIAERETHLYDHDVVLACLKVLAGDRSVFEEGLGSPAGPPDTNKH